MNKEKDVTIDVQQGAISFLWDDESLEGLKEQFKERPATKYAINDDEQLVPKKYSWCAGEFLLISLKQEDLLLVIGTIDEENNFRKKRKEELLVVTDPEYRARMRIEDSRFDTYNGPSRVKFLVANDVDFSVLHWLYPYLAETFIANRGQYLYSSDYDFARKYPAMWTVIKDKLWTPICEEYIFPKLERALAPKLKDAIGKKCTLLSNGQPFLTVYVDESFAPKDLDADDVIIGILVIQICPSHTSDLHDDSPKRYYFPGQVLNSDKGFGKDHLVTDIVELSAEDKQAAKNYLQQLKEKGVLS